MERSHHDFMALAREVETGANCVRGSVGVVVVRDGEIVATGFNETPAGMTDCRDGGCAQCGEIVGSTAPANDDRCLCVHGEVNAVAAAARAGIALDGAVLYTTKQPCTGCARVLVQAGVVKVFYEEGKLDWLDYGVDWPAMQARLAMEHLPMPA